MVVKFRSVTVGAEGSVATADCSTGVAGQVAWIVCVQVRGHCRASGEDGRGQLGVR